MKLFHSRMVLDKFKIVPFRQSPTLLHRSADAMMITPSLWGMTILLSLAS